jgi:5'-3' exonuclease
MNIVIDGNAFLNVSTSIVKNILANDKSVGEKYYVNDLLSDDKFMLKQASKDQFRKFSLNYLGSIFAPFKENISSVFIVFDSRSWRKQFIKDHFDEHGEGDFAYKGSRKYDDKSYLFFEYFQNELLPDLVEEYGVITARVHGAEGDDLIAYLCENVKEDICIWSVDKDMTQLLETGERKVILLMPKQQTKFKKIYTTTDFDNIEKKDVDLFNMELDSIDNSAVINVLNDLITKDYKHFRIDPAEDILLKILAGDSSDTIPRVHPRLTPGKVAKTVELIRETVDWNDIKNLVDMGDPEFMTFMNKVICDVLKISDPGESLTIQNNVSRNRRLIRLSTKVFPPEILEAITGSMNLNERRRFNYFKFKKNYKS